MWVRALMRCTRIVQQKKLHFHAALILPCSGGVLILALMLTLVVLHYFKFGAIYRTKCTLALEDEKCSNNIGYG